MSLIHPFLPWRRWTLLFAAPVVLIAGLARADAIWVGESAANPIKADGIKILRVDGSNLVFQGPGGDAVSRPMSVIQQIQVDDEPAFSAAEEAYRGGNTATAASDYATALHTSSKDWVQMRSAVRLTSLSSKSHAFDPAVSAFIFLVQKDPTLAVRPNLADADSGSLTSAAAQLKTALAAANLPATVRAPLLRLVIEIDRAKGDGPAADAALARLVALGVATPAENAAAALGGARVALSSGNFAGAVADIQKHRAMFTDPATQVDALDILARAQDGLARSANDPTALADVAIAYMRVVTFAKDVTGQPHAADALLRVGRIEQAIKDPRAAGDVYRQVIKEFPNTPAAATARSSLDQLSSSGS